MRLRSLSAVTLGSMLAVLLTAVPAQASGESVVSAPMSGVWKNSAMRRPGTTPPPIALAVAPSAAQVFQDRVLALTNNERRSRGLATLAPSACADGFADSWALSQAQRSTLGHQALQPIVTACRASMVAENVGVGSITPEQMVAMWMASSGHRENILRPQLTHLGVGAVSTGSGRWYAVQVFVRV